MLYHIGMTTNVHAINQSSIRAHTAGVSVQRPEAVRSKMYWVAMAGSLGLAFLGTVFGALSYFPAKFANRINANAEHESLAQHFKIQIADRLGVAPSEVTRDHLYDLATKDAAFAKLLEASAAEEKKDNRGSMIGAGVATALPVVGAVGSLAHIGTSLALTMGASIFDKDILKVTDVTDHIEAKLAANELATADDLMLLRVAQNDELSKGITEQYGKQFHKLNSKKRMEVIAQMPSLFDSTARDSTALNNQLVTTQDLAIEQAPKATNWSSRMSRKPSQGAGAQAGFRTQINQERALAAQNKTQV
jgi:hypothetical protein